MMAWYNVVVSENSTVCYVVEANDEKEAVEMLKSGEFDGLPVIMDSTFEEILDVHEREA